MTEPTTKLNFGRVRASKAAAQTPVVVPEPVAERPATPAPAVPPKAVEPKPSQTVAVKAPAQSLKQAPTVVLEVAEDTENPFIFDSEQDSSEDGAQTKGGAKKKASKRPSRFVLTEDHIAILHWIEKARYTSVEQVAVYCGKDVRWAHKQLARLVQHKYVGRKQYDGFPLGYYLTPASKDLVQSDTRAVDPVTGPNMIRHTFGVAWIILGFLTGRGPWAKAAENILKRPVHLEDFITEPEMIRAANIARGKILTRLEAEALDPNVQRAFIPKVHKWQAWDELSLHPIADYSDPLIYALFPDVSRRANFWRREKFEVAGSEPHFPDLVLALPPTGGKVNSVAFEYERSLKVASASKILYAYDRRIVADKDAKYPVLGTCVWVCGKERVKQIISERANTGFSVGTEEQASGWARKYLVELEQAAQAVRDANAAARQENWWHVTTDLRAVGCRCGKSCRARHGRMTQHKALQLIEELT